MSVDLFIPGGSARALFAAAIAVIPAIVAYVRGRQIVRFADDPALPERLFTGRRTTSRTLIFACFLLGAAAGRAALWAVPLALIGYFAASLPSRRILFNETWSLPAYLSFNFRFSFAFWSFWLTVCALPLFVLRAGDRAWIASAVLGTGLIALATWQTETIRWLLRAKPIADARIRASFERLAVACGIAMPRFDVIDLKGGSMANAFALASLGRSAVVFTGPLLERLDADEADAICAHELAHLEYYNARRLRQRRLISLALVAVGALLAPLLRSLNPAAASLVCVVWPIAVLAVVAAMVRDRQKHETASDLRAVALTGNPEALVRGLVKVHAMARVPRRWDADLERHMSHPSLKRRIQDIRGASGTPPAALGDNAAFESADGAARVVFAAGSLEWVEGASASYRLAYDRLRELRVAATRTGATSLLAADRAGHRWQMPLRIADVPRLQAVLDIVDARVGTGGAPVPVFQPLLVRVATLTACIVSLNLGMIGSAMMMALAIVRPSAPLLGGAGLAAIGSALLAWRDSGSGYGILPNEYYFVVGAVLLGTGAALVWIAYARRHDTVQPSAARLVGIAGAAAIVSWLLPLATGSFDAVGLYQSARDWPSTVVLPLGVAGAVMMTASRAAWRRPVVMAVLIASVAAAAVGSEAFLDHFGGDPFLVPAPEVHVRTLDRPVSEFTVPFAIAGLELSPHGRSIAIASRSQNARQTLHIGRAGGPLTAIDADGALFVDDDRAILWTADERQAVLREVTVAAPGVSDWQLHVAGLTAPSLSLDATTNRWRLASPGVDAVETREGVIGTGTIERHRWPVAAGHGAPLVPIAVAGDRALAVEPRGDLMTPLTNPFGGLMLALASTPRLRSTVWALGPDEATEVGTSRLELSCQRLSGGAACQVFDASRTRFFTMDPITRGFTASASLPGRFYTGAEPQSGWITGWYRSQLIAVRLAPVQAIGIAGPGGEHPHMLAASDRAAAGVWYRQTARWVVRIYAVD